MNVFLILFLLFFLPIILLIGAYWRLSRNTRFTWCPNFKSVPADNPSTVYLILSTCMGDSFRARLQGFRPVDPAAHGSYGRDYARGGMMAGAGGSGFGASEQIELQDMMGDDEIGRNYDD